MTDNLYNEKSAGRQSDKSECVLLPNEPSDSQESGQRGWLPRAVSVERNELVNIASLFLSGNLEIMVNKC